MEKMLKMSVEEHIREMLDEAERHSKYSVNYRHIEDLKKLLAVVRAHQSNTRIRVLNDTSKELTIRRPPTSHVVQSRKMMLEFVESNEVFLKIWDDGVILLSKDVVGAEPKKKPSSHNRNESWE